MDHRQQTKQYSPWHNADRFLDEAEKRGIFFKTFEGKKVSARKALERFLIWSLENGLQLTTDDDGEIFLRVEVEQEETACV